MSTLETKPIDQKVTKAFPENGKPTFVSNVSKIIGAAAFGQVLGIISLPIITRLFAPEAFGLLGLYTAIIGIIGVFVCMRYELAIVLPKDDNDAANLIWASIAFTLFWTLLAGLATIFFRNNIASLINAPEIAPFLWLVPIGIFLTGIHTAFSHWNTRRAQFGRLARVSIATSIVITLSKLSMGFGGLVSGGALIISSLIGTITGSYLLITKIWKIDRHYLISKISINRIRFLINQYSNISIFNSTSSLFISLSQHAPLILLAYFFSPVIVGYYLLANKLLKIPVNLIGNSVRKVYFQRASDEWNKTGNLTKLTLNVTTILSVISIGAMTIFISLIAPIAAIIFGVEWNVAGKYMQWIALATGVTFICNPISIVSIILRKENIVLYYQSYGFILRITALLMGGIVFVDPYISIILYSIAGMLYQLTFLNWILKKTELSLMILIKKVYFYLFLSTIVVIICLMCLYYDISLYIIISIVFIYSIIYTISSKSLWSPWFKNIF